MSGCRRHFKNGFMLATMRVRMFYFFAPDEQREGRPFHPNLISLV